MDFVTIILDEVSYEIPAAVEKRMREYLDAMNLLLQRDKQLREVARLDTVSRKKGATKEDRIVAWNARRELLNLYR